MSPRTLPHILTSVLLVLPACRTSGAGAEDAEQIVGAPPPREEDPFIGALPPEAEPAPARGTVGPSADPAPEPEPEPDSEPEPDPEPDREPEPEPEEPSRPAVAARAEPDEPEPAPPPDVHRCFSCVRVCPLSDQTADCSASAEDIICGWGTSPEREDARLMAQGECDATLDMARQMPRWSRIEGSCPEASCR